MSEQETKLKEAIQSILGTPEFLKDAKIAINVVVVVLGPGSTVENPKDG